MSLTYVFVTVSWKIMALVPYFLHTNHEPLKKIFLGSDVETTGQNSDHQTEDISDDFISVDTYTAVAPHESFPETVIPWECHPAY